jgi:molybdate transport system regulatory protein
MTIDAKFRLRIKKDSTIAVGPGKISLLEAVIETGSITAAAKKLEMSYRRAWLLIDEMNRCMKKPLIDTASGGKHGGGTTVTSSGLELIKRYRSIEREAAKATAKEIRAISKMLVD